MFERFITDWYFNLINLSEHVNRAIFRRLFLLYATSSLCFAGSFLRRLRPVTFFSVLFVGAYYPYLLSSQFYR
jgi:hypothetical protein